MFGLLPQYALADTLYMPYRLDMEPRRNRWLRSQKGVALSSASDKNADNLEFRSDNDLYQWRMWGRWAVPVTILCFGALKSFGVPFDYTPLAIVPVIVLFIIMKILEWRNRKAGKRFNQYYADDLFG